MEFAVVFIVGVLFGVILIATLNKSNSIGTLRIDDSDPYEEPYMFLELKKGVKDVYHKKYVVLRVNPTSYISQK